MKCYTSFLRLSLLAFCLSFSLIGSGCNLPKDVALMREASQRIEADTEALASQLVTDPILLHERKKKRDSIPPPGNGMGWLTSDLIMTIIMALLGVSSLKHGGQMVGGVAKLIAKVKK